MTYPSTLDNIPHVSDTVTDAKASVVDIWIDAINAGQTYVGLSGDVAASSGSLTSQIKYLLAAPGGITKATTAPLSPATNDLWIDTSTTDRPLAIFYSAAWHDVGANALQLRGVNVHTAAPTNGQVLTYDSANTRWAPAAATGGLTDPMTTVGDILIRDAGNATARLGIGTAGQLLGISGGVPAWTTASYVPAPGSPQQGDVLYYNGTTWTRLGPGTTGQFLKTLGASSNPAWSNLPSSPPGGAITDPGGEAQGDILYFDGVDWLPLAVGTSGQFLKTNGAGANPAWATPASGFSNPMTTLSDMIYADTGGTPLRLPIGTSNQVLTVIAGAPTWQNAASGFADPMTTAYDLIYRNGGNTTARLAKGSNGQVLSVAAGAVLWANPTTPWSARLAFA